VWDPDNDRRALQEAALDAKLDALLADDGKADAMISERRQKHLEALYDEAGLTPDRATLKTEASPPDAEGKPAFDPLIYAERLRDALIAAQPVTEAELTALAEERVDSVQQALSASVDLAPERLTTRSAREESADRDGQIRMPLEVSARGAANGNDAGAG